MEHSRAETSEGPSELNPYASPTAEPRPAPEAKKRFRWRVIPVTFLCVFGPPWLVATVAVSARELWWRLNNPDALELGVGPTTPMLVGDLFAVIAAALSLLTARRLWQGRWWAAGIAFSAAMLLAFVFGRLHGFE
jgi:hypothetical protein